MHTGILQMKKIYAENRAESPLCAKNKVQNPKNALLNTVLSDLTDSAQLAFVAASLKFIPSLVQSGVQGISSGDVRQFGLHALVEVLDRFTGRLIQIKKSSWFSNPLVRKAIYPLMAFIIACGVGCLR